MLILVWYLTFMAGVNPFPVGAPIRPESRQIGRLPAINALDRQVVEHRQHTLLIDERRVGKTSVAWAVLDRVRSSGCGWAIEVNLKRGPITTSAMLAQKLAEQARATGVGTESLHERVSQRLRDGISIGGKPIVKTLGELFGIEELVEAADVAQAIDQSLSTDEDADADLRTVLGALVAASIAADMALVIFIDEVQRLATDWSDKDDGLYVQEAFAEVMEEHDGHAVLLLAGSERTALAALLADGKPMHHDGMRFDLPPIGREDWLFELPRRFAEVPLVVEPERIEQILAVTNGHPARTMRVCAHVRELADGQPVEVTDVLVEQAIRAASRHPSWSD
jgi:hypothetical protein